MLAIVKRTPRHPGEEVGDFVIRRMRLAGRACERSGKWSGRWFTRAQEWNSHLQRSRNQQSWPPRLLHYMDRDWFIQRRVSLPPADGRGGSCMAGRTDKPSKGVSILAGMMGLNIRRDESGKLERKMSPF